MSETRVYESIPEAFIPSLDVVICFVQKQDRYLMLKKKSEQLWTAPGGKAEQGESMEQAIIRELEEETGHLLTEKTLKKIGCLYFDSTPLQFPMHIYHTCTWPITVELSEEHDQFAWYTREELFSLSKQPGAHFVIDFFLKKMNTPLQT